jgi:hypothetical protein
MANEQFNRMILNPRERPLSSDINQAQSQLDRTQREILKAMFASRTGPMVDTSAFVAGFIGDGFKVRAAAIPDMTTTVTAGMGFYQDPADVPAAIGGIIGLDDYCSYKPLPLIAPLVIPVPTAPAAFMERWDIIEVAVTRRAENGLVRETFDPTTSAFVAGLVNKTLSFSLDSEFGYAPAPGGSVDGISYVQGVAAAVGAAVVPAVTPGYQKIGEVYVGSSVTAIPAYVLNDYRKMLAPGGVVRMSLDWTQNTAAVPSALHIAAPPGVVATIRAATAAGGYIIIIAGGAAGATVTMSAEGAGWVGASPAAATLGLIDAAYQTILANIAQVSNVIAAGIGQPFFLVPYYLYNASGPGAVQSNTVTSVVTAQVAIRY